MKHAAAVAALLVFWAAPAFADTSVPTCRGHDTAAAAAARTEGLRHYRASKREGAGDAEMTTALGFFDAACAAGDDTALELRAYALAGMDRFVEASETLDVFLAAHALPSLPAATRARLAAQQPAILARVASLSITTPQPGASVSVNHQPVGTTPLLHPLRLAPGKYDVEVTVAGKPPLAKTLDLAAGERTETFDPSLAPPPVVAAVAVASATDAAPLVAPAADKPFLSPLVLGTGIATVAMVGLGVGGLAWSGERHSLYDSNDCATVPRYGCTSVLSQYHAAEGVEIAGFAAAGVGAIVTGVLFYLDHRQPHAPVAPLGSLSCTLPGAAVSCAVHF